MNPLRPTSFYTRRSQLAQPKQSDRQLAKAMQISPYLPANSAIFAAAAAAAAANSGCIISRTAAGLLTASFAVDYTQHPSGMNRVSMPRWPADADGHCQIVSITDVCYRPRSWQWSTDGSKKSSQSTVTTVHSRRNGWRRQSGSKSGCKVGPPRTYYATTLGFVAC